MAPIHAINRFTVRHQRAEAWHSSVHPRRLVWRPTSRRLQEGFPDRGGQLDGSEEHFRVEIIFTRLVNDPHQAMPRGLRIGQRSIDLAHLKSGGITLILDTYQELSGRDPSWHSYAPNEA